MIRVRCRLVREEVAGHGTEITSPRDIAAAFHALYGDESVEVLVVFHLDARHRVIGFEEVSRGTLNASLVHPREVFKAALLSNAHAIVAVHNHPSGDATPSAADRIVTTQLRAAGMTLGVELLDHLVVAGGTGIFRSTRGWRSALDSGPRATQDGCDEREPLLNAGQVAELLSVNVRTVHRRAVRGEIPFTTVGGVRRFRSKDVRALRLVP